MWLLPQLRPSPPRPILKIEEINAGLRRLCVPSDQTLSSGYRISQKNVRSIQEYLQVLDSRSDRVEEQRWKLRPRLYAILLNIDATDLMSMFISENLTDFNLPFNEHTLPQFIGEREGKNLRHAFFAIQGYCLTDTKSIESKESEHCTLTESGDTYFIPERPLGQGSFGGVDLVFSRLSTHRYARKRVLRARGNEQSQSYLIKELQELRRLNHQHLVQIIGSYTDIEYIAYLMKPVAQCTLEEFLNTPKPLDGGHKVILRRFYGCLAGAVNYLYAERVRHRDLTARNILIDSSWEVYISDFGSAYNWASKPSSKTKHRNIPTSPDYMAPEVSSGDERGTKSDMWSLGIVFLEMTSKLLDHRPRELREKIRIHSDKARVQPYPYANIKVLRNWMQTLGQANTEYGQDREPLSWTRELLHAEHEHRIIPPQLMRYIRESPSFGIFCCLKCEQQFLDDAYAYGPMAPKSDFRRESHETREAIVAYFDDHMSKPSISREGSDSIKKWIENSTGHKISDARPSAWQFQGNAWDEKNGQLNDDTHKEELLYRVSDYGFYSHSHLVQDVVETPSNYVSAPLPAHEDSTQLLADGLRLQKGTNIQGTESISSGEDRPVQDSGLGFLEYISNSSDGEKPIQPFEECSDHSTTPPEEESDIGSWEDPIDALLLDGGHPSAITNESETKENTENLFEEEEDRSEGENPWDEAVDQSEPETMAHSDEQAAAKNDNPTVSSVHHQDPGIIKELPDLISWSTPDLSGPPAENRQKNNGTELEGAFRQERQDKGPAPDDVSGPSIITEGISSTTTAPQDDISASFLSPENLDGKESINEDPSAGVEDVAREGGQGPRPNKTTSDPIAKKKSQKQVRVSEKLEYVETGTEDLKPNARVGASSMIVDPAWSPRPNEKAKPEAPRIVIGPPRSSIPSETANASRMVFDPPQSSDPYQAEVPRIIIDPPRPSKYNERAEASAPRMADPPRPHKPKAEAEALRIIKEPRYKAQPSPARLSKENVGRMEKKRSSPIEPRKRDTLMPVDVNKLMQNTWGMAEMASSAPTSVMSGDTKSKISRFFFMIPNDSQVESALSGYCKKGSAAAVKTILHRVVSKDKPLKHRQYFIPLLHATRGATSRHNKCVRELLAAGVNPNRSSKRTGQTPLHIAVQHPNFKGYANLIWLLLANTNKADPNIKDWDGETPLTRLFIGANTTPLEPHKRGALIMLLKEGANADFTLPGTGNTPLHLAVRRQDKVAVAMLLHMGSGVNVKNTSGTTPLQMTAIQFRRELGADQAEVLDHLLQYGAHVDERAGVMGRTALHLAVIAGCAQAVTRLLEAGANPRLRDTEEQDAMTLAIKHVEKLTAGAEEEKLADHVEIMVGLYNAAKLKWVLKEGTCAIETACRSKHGTLLKSLLQRGLDPKFEFRGATISEFARLKGSKTARDLLVNV